MRRRLIAALLSAMLLALCGCGSQTAESSSPAETEPMATEAPAPVETETPAPEETEEPAPAETETPAFETAETPAPEETEIPAPEETETPAVEEEEIRLTNRWQLAYQALLEDPELLDRVIGEGGDYRKGYFGGWGNEDYQLSFSSYAAADLDGDGIPELLLDSKEMGLTDLIGWNGDYVYIGYDDYLGLLPELNAVLVHGHWHGAGGSYFYEYAVSRMPEHELIAYFDHSDPSYGEVTWSFLEEGSEWYSGSQEGDSRRYDAMMAQYVTPAIRLEDLEFCPLQSLRGLAEPQDLSLLPSQEEVRERFPGSCRRFLRERAWQSLGLDLAEEGLEAALWDLDRDGIQELLLRDTEHCVLFRYDGGGDRMTVLGQVESDVVGIQGQSLVTRTEDGWMLYSKRHAELKDSFSPQFSEDYSRLLDWADPEELAGGIF